MQAEQEVFRAVAEPTRRQVLEMLAESDRSVTALLARFAISQPAMSKHLRVLREAGLVSERADGRRRIYHLNPEPLRSVHDWVARYERFWLERLEGFGAALDRRAATPGDEAPRTKPNGPAQ
jgi:DNA-binding transcriptional ArsR family regulator